MKSIHLSKAAAILIEKMKDPASLLSFIVDSQNWYNNYKFSNPPKSQGEDYSFNISQLIEDLIIPWMQNEKEAEKAIEKGLERVWDLAGYQGFAKLCALIMASFAHDLLQTGPISSSHYQKAMKGIEALYEVGYCLADYEEERVGMFLLIDCGKELI
jgi:hypothetical protein